MRRLTPLVVLLVIAASSAVAGVPMDAGPSSPSDDPTIPSDEPLPPPSPALENTDLETAPGVETTTRLSLPDDNVTDSYLQGGPDLATTVAIGDGELRGAYDDHYLERALDEATTDEERERLLETALEDVEGDLERLEEREREAVRSFHAGDANERALVTTLVHNYRDAQQLGDRIDAIDAHAGEVSGFDVPSITRQTLEVQLSMHESPVRERIDDRVGAAPADPAASDVVYVEATDDGVVAATIDGTQYVREAVRFDHRDPSAADQFDGASEAYDRTQEIYPWALDRTSPTYIPYHDIQLYTVEVAHSQGSLTAYLDGGTAEIYRELQTLRMSSLPTAEPDGPWEEDGLNVSIQQTPERGPIEVTALDADTGDPVQASVYVEGTHLGETDDDGTLWTIPTRGEYTVTVETATGSVNATVPAAG